MSLRDNIIQASVELGSQLGEDGLTMRGIASKLGVSATALYQHFDSKAAILREIRFHGIDRLWDAIAPSAQVPEPRERIVSMGERYVQFAIANPWLYTVLMEHEQVDWSQLSPEELERFVRPLTFVQASLAEGKASGAWGDSLDVEMATFRLWAAMHGMCSLIINGRIDENHPVFPVSDCGAYARQFIRVVVGSLAS